MATIRQRKDSGMWQAIIERKGFPSQSKTFKLKSDAEKWARDIENKIDRGVFVDRSEAEGTTLSDALDKYEKEISIHKKSHKNEQSIIKQIKKHSIVNRSLASLKNTDFKQYLTDILKGNDKRKGVAPATAKLDLALLSHLFTIAATEWSMGIANPLALVRMPKIKNARERRFEGDEEKRLMKALDDCENPFVKPLVLLALATGARMGELRKLEWRYVDIKNSTARLVDTKNGDDRVIPLSSTAKKVLESMPRDISGMIFPKTKDSISHAFSNACKRAEIDNFRFHDLRHEAVSRLFEKDLNVMEVASVSGHKTLQMLKRYTHVHAQKLAAKLG
jgi:integrase